jgi:hypothetical protein
MVKIFKTFSMLAMLAVASLSFVACDSADWSNPEKMTNKQLIAEAQKQNKYPVCDFFIPDTFDVEMEECETWHQIWLNSASTVEEETKQVEEFKDMQNASSHEITYIGENDYFYQFILRYQSANIPEHIYTDRIIIWKYTALCCTFNNNNGYSFEIRSLDIVSVRNILDLYFYIYNWSWCSARIIHRELTEDSIYFYYTFYETFIVGGDWGVYDTANLEKRQSRINKQTGELQIDYYNARIKSVHIPGTKHNGIEA